MKDLSSVTQIKLEQLSVQKKGFEVSSNAIQSLVDFVEQNITNATEEELLTIRTQMFDRIDEETRKYCKSSPSLEPVKEADIVVKVECAEEIRRICHTSTRLNQAIECTVEGLGATNVEAGQTALFTMSCMLPGGKLSARSLVVDVKITSCLDGSVIQAEYVSRVQNVFNFQYAPQIRGEHKLDINANGVPAIGSPFSTYVRFPISQLGKPLNVIEGIKLPISVAINSVGEILVAEQSGGIVVFDKSGKRIRSIEKNQHSFKCLQSIAIDKDDNIYVSDIERKSVAKFNHNGELVTISSRNTARYPHALTIVGQHVIVTQPNKKLVILTKDLEYVCQLDYAGDGSDIAHDGDKHLYLSYYAGGCVDVLQYPQSDTSFKGLSKVVYSFNEKQSSKLKNPHSICIDRAGFVYVSECSEEQCISVFTKEGNFVASFGSRGKNHGQFERPCGLACDTNGILYVCDYVNDRLQLF